MTDGHHREVMGGGECRWPQNKVAESMVASRLRQPRQMGMMCMLRYQGGFITFMFMMLMVLLLMMHRI